jgi:hypothetical protein
VSVILTKIFFFNKECKFIKGDSSLISRQFLIFFFTAEKMSCLSLRRGSQEKTNATSLSGDIDEKYKNAQPFEPIELLNTLDKIAIPLIQPIQLPNKKAPLFRTLFLGVHVCVL